MYPPMLVDEIVPVLLLMRMWALMLPLRSVFITRVERCVRVSTVLIAQLTGGQFPMLF